MQKNYVIGGVIALLVIGAFLFVIRSPDAGGTGATLTPATSFSHSHGIAVDPTDAKKVYIATHEGLYLLQGAELFHVGKTRDDLMGFSAHPTLSGVFFSSGHKARGGNIGFQKTADGGITWEQISTGLGGTVDFHAMIVSPVNPDLVYGFFGGKLQRSIDGGRSWEYAKGTVAPISLSADPVNESVLYAATERGIQVSKDRGESWASLSPELEGSVVTVIVFNPQNAKQALAFSEKLGGMAKSVDGGLSWQRVNETFGGEMVLYLAFSSTADTVYALTAQNSLYNSTNQGDNWQKVR